MVDTVHILPWSLTRSDIVQNGMALCRLCHWTFDEGLITVSGTYAVPASNQLSSTYQLPSHMQTLSEGGINGPAGKQLYPAPTHSTGIIRKNPR